MHDQFGSVIHCAVVADKVFHACWSKATVTVQRADGEQFFID